MKIDTLFLSGCGTKGSAFIGSLKYLYEKDILKNIIRYVCVSGSSIIGVLLCCGYNINTIYHINNRLNYTDLIDLDDLDNIFNNKGLFKNDKIGDLIESILYKKYGIRNMTLKVFYDKSKIHYICKVYNLSKKCDEYFCYKTNPELKVSTLIKMTTCIPFFFKPIQYDKYYYIDGGILCMMPYIKKYKNYLGIHIHGEKNNDLENMDIFKYITYYCDILSHKSKINIINDRMIHIYTKHMPCIDFDVCNNDKIHILKDGYIQTQKHIEKYNLINKL